MISSYHISLALGLPCLCVLCCAVLCSLRAMRDSGARRKKRSSLKSLAAVRVLSVDLWDESTSDAGVAALAASLPRSKLRVLGLWGTPLTDGDPGSGLHDSSGLAALAHSLPLSPQLQELNLFGNAHISPVGCRVLCAAVKNSGLTGLTLSIDLPASLAEALRQALDDNSARESAAANAVPEEAAYDPTDVSAQAQAYLAMGGDGPPTRLQWAPQEGGGDRNGQKRRRGGTRQAREIAAERRARAAQGLPANRRPGGAMARRTHPTLERVKEPIGQVGSTLPPLT